MVFTESINYHATHIGAIQTNKEEMNIVYNVGIYITRRRFGEYQEVEITGSIKDISNCKKSLEKVVEKAEIDYQDYMDRKKRRKGMKPKKLFKCPIKNVIKKKYHTNPFAALEEIDESKDEGKSESYNNIFPILSTYNSNVSWGDMSDDE